MGWGFGCDAVLEEGEKMKCPKCGKETYIRFRADLALDEYWAVRWCFCGWEDEKEVG